MSAPEDKNQDSSGIAPEFLDLRRAEQEGEIKNIGDAPDSRDNNLSSKEASGGDPVGGGFWNPQGKHEKNILKTLSRRKKWLIGGAFISGGFIAGLLGFFLGFGSLNLSNFMSNVEQKAFLRYQVDMNGRSSKWINTYMALRFSEVEGGDPVNDNLYFIAKRSDNNKPLTDWYRTMRSSKFEEEVFNKRGIFFRSVARKEGNKIVFRTAVFKIHDKEVPFTANMTAKEWDSIDGHETDLNNLSARTWQFFEQDGDLMRDKDARNSLRKVLKDEYPHWWQAYKRRYMRLDMQNRLGIRKWMFFETSRHKLAEGIQERRNRVVGKVITSATPADGASGRFLNCLFGLNDCSAPKDPAHKAVIAGVAEIAITEEIERELEHHYGADGNNDGRGDSTSESENESAREALEQANKDGKSNVAGEAGSQIRVIISKFIRTVNIVGITDAVMKFHNALYQGKLTSIIAATKTQYAMGLYTTFKIADDQMKTGEMNGDEFGDFMSMYGNMSNSEGWNTAIAPKSSSSLASAATSTYKKSENRDEFCRADHQAEMEKPSNKEHAEAEFQYLCPKDRIGGAGNAKELEDAWSGSVGPIIDPIAKVWGKTGGPIADFVNDSIGLVLDPVVEGAITASGQGKNIEDLMGYVAEKALEFGGANMNIDSQTPSGRMGNLVIEGGGALAEQSARLNGAAKTNETMRAHSNMRVLAHQEEKINSLSFYDRYLSTSNPVSFASSQIPTIASLRYDNFAKSLGSVFASILSMPSKLLSLPVSADEQDGYAVAKFAGLEDATYDFPAECIDANPLEMTPASATNADDLGYIPASELSWDLMSNKMEWYGLLYEKVGKDGESKAEQVWNCALIDNAVRGGIGEAYGYRGADAMQDSSGGSSSASTANVPSGSAQELAKLIVDSKKITGDPRYYSQIQNIAKGDGSCPVDERILTMLAGLAQEGHSVYITSLNRRCTGVLTASGTGSHHYRDGGGHAVDIGTFNGATTTGGNSATLKLLNAVVKYLPEKGTEYGQVLSCGSGFDVPSGSVAVEDSCNHQHIGVSN